MPTEERALTMTELASVAGVTPRTIRYYIAQGLLPAPDELGRGAHYDRSYLDRLALIKGLQKQHLPLAEIRDRLAGLTNDQVRDLVAAPAEPAPTGDALAYIRSVLGGGQQRPAMAAARLMRTEAHVDALIWEPDALATRDQMASPAPQPAATQPTPTTERSQWDRIAIGPDVEIHVRRPLDRQTNKNVDRLIAIARELLGEEQP
jgi:DNA-binding transcriptional MerR regulator